MQNSLPALLVIFTFKIDHILASTNHTIIISMLFTHRPLYSILFDPNHNWFPIPSTPRHTARAGEEVLSFCFVFIPPYVNWMPFMKQCQSIMCHFDLFIVNSHRNYPHRDLSGWFIIVIIIVINIFQRHINRD